LKLREVSAKKRLLIDDNVARLNRGLDKGLHPSHETIENMMRDRMLFGLLSDAVAMEIMRRLGSMG